MIDRLRVLLVEDNPADARWVREMLAEDTTSEFDLVHAATVRDAVDYLAAHGNGLDAVLLDLSLPDESGLNTLQRVLTVAHTAVVIVMTGQGDEQVGLAAMQAGAQDYLVKGQVDGRTLRRALRFALERQTVLQRLSHRDDLTGLHNRRGFMLQAEQLTRVARRQRAPFLLLFMDLDQLKVINDTFGHAEGNRALVEAADVLRRCFRQSDLLARFGGDEFAALALSSGDADDAVMRARLEGALDAVNVKPDRDYPLSFSVGILTCGPAEEAHIEELLEQADRMMYQEKRLKSERMAFAEGPSSAA
ncbi:MAG: GGDEF domain-containing response regulator [Acidobacteria bacterium]|nr:GGDEF domain-containing response regulator [Acidobacteriota bacterium]